MVININTIKTELLAPAGDFKCFQAAINAGADAVYLGGAKFGARAYANNFTEEEIISAIKIAHLFDKKVYLTVNTLVKDCEIKEIVPYITPLYNAGLDAVIVQDIGVIDILQKNFPDLEIHASTQMTITGIYGAKFLKNMGICRVVPARELSFQEIKDIKEETGLEIETFIHGAMCYGYSGQCLFSSILGGRSGNRGRCAGPCRLPYTNDQKHTTYPLSLKDMYTLPLIPKLIQSGVDSFKIEGRMKSPEYVAGVTAMYRKYIDMYLKNPDKKFTVSKKDEEILRNLYIRTDICNGYYEQHNSKSMVTISEPGYCGSSKEVLNDINEKYLSSNITIPIRAFVRIISNEKAVLTLSSEKASVTVEGEIVTPALNRPLSEEEIIKRLSKTGDTFFTVEDIVIDTDNNSFMPVKALNELRRYACEQLENEIIRRNTKKASRLTNIFNSLKPKACFEQGELYASITTKDQLLAVLNFSKISGIYVNSDLFINDSDFILKKIDENNDKNFYITLPAIMRKKSYDYLTNLKKIINTSSIKGIMVKNLEELQWLYDINYNGDLISDFSLYAWNTTAVNTLLKHFNRVTIPLELNRREVLDLHYPQNTEMLLYGRIPLMYSANCIKKTLDKCIRTVSSGQNVYNIVDRYKNTFPIVQNCHHCYNILYNTVPMSLHNHLKKLMESDYSVYRLDFTLETFDETKELLDYYINTMFYGKDNVFPVESFTNGHYKRGVE